MSAANLRRIGSRRIWVDPAAVVAVHMVRTHSVDVLLAGGGSVRAVFAGDVDNRELTQADVDYVVAQLTEDLDVPRLEVPGGAGG